VKKLRIHADRECYSDRRVVKVVVRRGLMPRRAGFAKSAWSVFLRIEELILASSGADAFEVAFSLSLARLYAKRSGQSRDDARSVGRRETETLLREARRAWPGLGALVRIPIPDETLRAVVELLDCAGLDEDAEGVDALFEQLVTRVGKGQKGQFFTPRHVVDFAIGALALADGERFVDPACGSGAFVLHARAAARVDAWGYDIDARAVRVAKLLAIAGGFDADRFAQKDSLSPATRVRVPPADVVATNPPFAGAPDARGFEVANLGGAAMERDGLFLERCLGWLAPRGRLAIVLPHGKVASPAWTKLRAWTVERARVYAVVSLPVETFLPHTSQRTVLLLAKKRAAGETPSPEERIFFGISTRAGRDKSGEPVLSQAFAGIRPSWRDHDHDLAELAGPLSVFLEREGFAERKVRHDKPRRAQTR
jgi:type I restriction enzyme M protein